MEDGVLASMIPQAVGFRLRAAAPTGVEVRAASGGVEMRWDGPASPIPVTGYKVYRRTSHGPAEVVATIAARRQRFTDTRVPPEEAFLYSVAALNPAGEGPRSAEVAVLIPPGLVGGRML